jgi:hypothetical protein
MVFSFSPDTAGPAAQASQPIHRLGEERETGVIGAAVVLDPSDPGQGMEQGPATPR